MTILPFRRSPAQAAPEPPRPVIGITSYGRDEKRRFRLSVDYVDAVRAAGGIPIILPPEEAAIRATFDLLDGLILSGGGDIAPERYRGERHPRVYNVDERRDEYEFELCALALEHHLPLLCICRGAQLLNVTLGGSLHPHLPDVVGDGIAHQVDLEQEEDETAHSFHPVMIDPSSRLSEILGVEVRATRNESQVSLPLEIASWHHQSVRDLAEGLRVSAWAADGTIEAFELEDDRPSFVQALQWHPEITAARDPFQQRLFDALVKVARER